MALHNNQPTNENQNFDFRKLRNKGHIPMLKTYREIFDRAIGRALEEKGIASLKKTSMFGSNDPANKKVPVTKDVNN